jgi:UDPglucose 6-dehydrogenase
MNIRSAELAKYACNAFLAMKISFANEIANLCDVLGANYEDVRQGLGTDSRIGRKFLYAGIGYGGSCFPKDVRALTQIANDAGYQAPLLQEVENTNDRQKERMLRILEQHYGTTDFTGKVFAIWGLAFKPGTDDMREAPSITILNHLVKAGAKIQASDPVAEETARMVFGDNITYTDMYSALKGADALLVLTEWPMYQEPDFDRIKADLKVPLLFDGRNIHERAAMQKLGIQYYGIGTNV